MLPPSGWGPTPFDERDLDAVLDGETADVPVALRPVADALATLRAAPAPAELRGEADAMAEFRALRLNHAGATPTLLLSAVPGGQPRRRSARYRGRRRLRRPVSLRAGAAAAVAAAAAVGVAALLTNNLPGPIERLTGVTHSPTASSAAAHPRGNSASPKQEATSAAVVPSASASAAGPATPQSQLSNACRVYYAAYEQHPVTQSGLSAEVSAWQQLTKLVGSRDPQKVYQDCARYVGNLPSAQNGQGHGHPGQQFGGLGGQQYDAPGNQQNGLSG